MFLTPDEIATLTGIKKGRGGKSREQMQVEQLRKMAVPFRVNARGAPVVTWEGVNGVNKKQEGEAWEPNILRHAA